MEALKMVEERIVTKTDKDVFISIVKKYKVLDKDLLAMLESMNEKEFTDFMKAYVDVLGKDNSISITNEINDTFFVDKSKDVKFDSNNLFTIESSDSIKARYMKELENEKERERQQKESNKYFTQNTGKKVDVSFQKNMFR